MIPSFSLEQSTGITQKLLFRLFALILPTCQRLALRQHPFTFLSETKTLLNLVLRRRRYLKEQLENKTIIIELPYYHLLLNLVLRLSKNASLVLIVPGSGTGLPGRLDSLVTSPSGTSLEPPGTLIGVDMDSLSPSRNSLVILLAVRLCMYICLFGCLSGLSRTFSLLLRRFE